LSSLLKRSIDRRFSSAATGPRADPAVLIIVTALIVENVFPVSKRILFASSVSSLVIFTRVLSISATGLQPYVV
jgi:hypothetical protein